MKKEYLQSKIEEIKSRYSEQDCIELLELDLYEAILDDLEYQEYLEDNDRLNDTVQAMLLEDRR